MTLEVDCMTHSRESGCWSLQAFDATFDSPGFCASLDLLRPSGGLTDLKYRGATIAGIALGISPSDHKIGGSDEIADAYVRGTDLVVTYTQTEERPFALQVYWRVSNNRDDVVQLDAIVSLQTCLLESFPNIWTSTNLPGNVADGLQVGSLLRSDAAWSYAESVQPEDRGTLRSMDSSGQDHVRIAHQLGGQFLEKGVIRRLRVRGLFLPRDNDIELAEKYLASMKSEELPLTV